jgi:hypothetical protein
MRFWRSVTFTESMDCSRAKTHLPDEWLEMTPEFSRPIATELRELFLRWEPDLSESIKWNVLCFSGRKLVCGISACKKHLSVAFFRGTELAEGAELFSGGESNTNIRSVRITDPEQMDRDGLRRLLRAAVELDADPTAWPVPKIKRAPIPPPAFFKKALKENPRAAEGFKGLSPTRQREYIIWLTAAKRPETRAKRLKKTLAALGKGRPWIEREGKA